jgi:starch-binding outer membrane protein, SusD/RagB family
MKKKILSLMLMGSCIAAINSCTKLQETVLDEAPIVGLNDKQIAEGLIAPMYAILPSTFQHTNYFTLQEISTDEAILPYRGGTDWGDNGIYLAMHRHETTSTDPNVRGTWNFIFQGISRALTAITELPANNDPSAKVLLAEARGMRAYYSMLTLDMWGVVFVKEDVRETSEVIRGQEAIDYIKAE